MTQVTLSTRPEHALVLRHDDDFYLWLGDEQVRGLHRWGSTVVLSTATHPGGVRISADTYHEFVGRRPVRLPD